ncbi:MAG: HEPN domain-containing protein [Myxococcota bacterium]
MRPDAQAWLDAAAADELAVETLAASGNHALAVFHAQQAAEKRLKAACTRKHRAIHTHSLLQLLDELAHLGFSAPDAVAEAARRLEAHYTAARYPNGFGPSPGPLYDGKLVDEARSWLLTIAHFADSLR